MVRSFSYHPQGIGFAGLGDEPPMTDLAAEQSRLETVVSQQQRELRTLGTGAMIALGILGVVTTGFLIYGGYRLVKAVAR